VTIARVETLTGRAAVFFRGPDAAVFVRIELLTRRAAIFPDLDTAILARLELRTRRASIFRAADAAVLARVELRAWWTSRLLSHPDAAIFERDVQQTGRALRARRPGKSACGGEQ
jgi:hypothetical protein